MHMQTLAMYSGYGLHFYIIHQLMDYSDPWGIVNFGSEYKSNDPSDFYVIYWYTLYVLSIFLSDRDFDSNHVYRRTKNVHRTVF